MEIWKYSYYPSADVRESPERFLINLSKDSPHEAALIEQHLSTMCRIENHLWPHDWRKQISKNHYQHSVGDHRFYYGLYGREIVVFHICRKRGKKALGSDLNRARLNQEEYEKWRK
jgi:hypothetical protein